MKRKITVLLFAVAFATAGCSDDDDTRNSNGLHGRWHLVKLWKWLAC